MNFTSDKRQSVNAGVARIKLESSEALYAAVDAKPGHRVAIAMPSNMIHVFYANGLALQGCIQVADLPVPLAN